MWDYMATEYSPGLMHDERMLAVITDDAPGALATATNTGAGHWRRSPAWRPAPPASHVSNSAQGQLTGEFLCRRDQGFVGTPFAQRNPYPQSIQ